MWMCPVVRRLGAAILMCMGGHAAAAAPCTAWPAWDTFKRQFISDDGRVIDPASPRRHTTSEGQAYALFFSLVANDRSSFDRLLRWTEDNLAAGDLAARLPAWQWGRRDDGSWQVVDANAASDADLWMAYALGEAGRLWGQRRYVALASLLADRVLREETHELPGYGRTLLPGPQGFGPRVQEGRLHARLNASYLPVPVLRWLANRSGSPAWQAVLSSSLRVIEASAPRGYVADWVLYESGPAIGAQPGPGPAAAGAEPALFQGGYIRLPNAAEQRVGSYDAIRSYLWTGITSPQDPARAAMLERQRPMADWIEQRGAPPEQIDPRDGAVQGEGPSGFSAAALPFLAAAKRPAALKQQWQRLNQHPPRDGAYYEQALALFGLGFHEERYRLDHDGTLLPAWISCTKPLSPLR